MALLPPPIDTLLSALSKLPGIGPRSAERIALHIVQSDAGSVRDLAAALINARQLVSACANCGALTEQQPCGICSDPKRDAALLCVVERAVDVISLEKSGTFRGRYHVLGGKISPLNGVGPEDLRVAELQARLTTESVQEIVIALPSDVEGDATSYYLAKLLAGSAVTLSRIAQGLPVGGGLEFADELTLSRAMEGRRTLRSN
jgi:recombination protein RecR